MLLNLCYQEIFIIEQLFHFSFSFLKCDLRSLLNYKLAWNGVFKMQWINAILTHVTQSQSTKNKKL